MITDPGVSAIKNQSMQAAFQPAIVVSFIILIGVWVIVTTWIKK